MHANRLAVAVAALLPITLLSVAALARPHGVGRDHLARLEAAVSRIDIDSETRESVYELLDEARSERRDSAGELHDAHELLRSLLEQEEPDTQEVLAQAEILGELKTEQRKADLMTILAVRSLVGAERWQELREAMHPREGGPGQRGRVDADADADAAR